MRRLRLPTTIGALAIAGLIGAACGIGPESAGDTVDNQIAETGATASTTAAIGSSSIETDGNSNGFPGGGDDDRDSFPDGGDGDSNGFPDGGDDNRDGSEGSGLVDPDTSGIELASTPEFCAAAETLIGSMETVGFADLDQPAQVRWAYTETQNGLTVVAALAPNAGVAGQIRQARELFFPLADLLAANDWDVSAIDANEAAELAILSESAGPALSVLTDDFERYVGAECDVDVVQARADGVDRLLYDLSDTVPKPVTPEPPGRGSVDPAADLAIVEKAPFGERGGALFCAADRLWVDAITAVDRAEPDDVFVDTFLASADVYTTWGERLPPAMAVTTFETTVTYAEVVAIFGETLDVGATRSAYQSWRTSTELLKTRSEINDWITVNC